MQLLGLGSILVAYMQVHNTHLHHHAEATALYNLDLAPSDFHLFLNLKKSLSGQRQRFYNDREAEMSVTVTPIPGGRLLRHKIQPLVPRYDNYLNSGGEYVEK